MDANTQGTTTPRRHIRPSPIAPYRTCGGLRGEGEGEEGIFIDRLYTVKRGKRGVEKHGIRARIRGKGADKGVSRARE